MIFFAGGNLVVTNPVDFCEMLRSQYGDPRAPRRGGA